MSHQVTLSWDASADPGVQYNIYRGNSEDNESNIPLNSAPLSTNTFSDTTVLPGHIYFYEVTSIISGIESVDSLELKIPAVPFDPTPEIINLGRAAGFGVLAGSAVTNTGPTTVVGDVGVSPGSSITGFDSNTAITGAFHAADFVAAAAQLSLTAAYNQAANALKPGGAPADSIPADIGGMILGPSVYKATSSLGITGTLVLDAKGNPDAVFIFQIGSTLTVAGNIVLRGGAQASNIFWQVGSSATIGVGSAMFGNIMALASITMVTNSSIDGRLLARNGAVTLDSNAISLLQVSQLLLSWTANTPYRVGQVLFDCATNAVQVVTVGGTSGTIRPTFSSVPGVTVQDGTVTWMDPTFPLFVLTPTPPSPANTPPEPPTAPLNLHVTSES
jgi:Ice-binding-like